MNTEHTEKISLDKLKAGDRAEFARLVEAHSGQIYRLAMKMLRNAQDAEDILQETFIKAYDHIQGFEGRSSLSTWLYRIATNEALMFIRKQKDNTTSIDEPYQSDDGDEIPKQIIDWCCLPEKDLMSSESREYLDQAVESLPETMRIVFLLRDVEGLSTRETAEVLDLSESAVKTRLSRARLKLREELSTYFGQHLEDAKLSRFEV